MQFISGDKNTAIQLLFERLSGELQSKRKILWLVSGGSNIAISVAVSKLLKQKFSNKELKNISITLTDERFGPVGHKDSNWKQLFDEGLEPGLFSSHPVLIGESLEATTRQYGKIFEKLRNEADIVIGQFGIGVDAHIAGILPNSTAVDSKEDTASYETPKFTRTTLTFKALEKVDVAYVFAFGAEKKEAILTLQRNKGKLSEAPILILHKLKECHFASDAI